ncbi:MAG: transglycosylase SLT domain-containing protein [Candidatus Pacearchaeota archaeon]
MKYKNKNISVKKIFLVGFVFMSLILLTFFVSAQFLSSSYSRNYVQNSQSNIVNDALFSPSFSRQMCHEGQDFILQISPIGCSPSVVRSDLLENQNVPVICPVVGTQINPLIDIGSIDRITFSGDFPREVSGVGFHSARAALNRFGGQIGLDNPPVLDNLGYAVIVLRQQRNESEMPDFVEGNLTARIRYDVQNAFGVGRSQFYLPVMSDTEWDRNFKGYGFWQGRGYLRAESVSDDRASISIYSDRETNSQARTANRKVTTENLLVGEKSREIPMPGFDYCVGTMEIRLDGVENPDTTATIEVNGDAFDLREGAKFLNNDCQVRSINKEGIVEEVQVDCNVDEGSNRLNLRVSPNIKIEIDGESSIVGVGDQLYSRRDSEGAETGKYVYVGYIGEDDGEELFFVPVVSTAKTSEEFKQRAVYRSLPSIMNVVEFESGNVIVDSLERIVSLGFGFVGSFVNWMVAGDAPAGLVKADGSFEMFPSPSGALTQFNEIVGNEDAYSNKFKIIGFADAVDSGLSGLSEEHRRDYENAVRDYEDVLQSFSGESYPSGTEPVFGESALRNLIEIHSAASQMRTVVELCEEFEDAYPNSGRGMPDICSQQEKLSSQTTSAQTVLIKGKTYSISLDRISEPSLEDYSVDITVSNAGNYSGRKTGIRKDQTIYLSESEFISLQELNDNNAIFNIRGIDRGSQVTTIGNTQRINLNSFEVVGENNYRISVDNINLRKVARVSIIPNVDYQETQAEFPFRIGIEKRNDFLMLSPEKTEERINSLEETLETWRRINEGLKTTVDIGNKACLGVGAGLVLKSFISNLHGEGIARQKIMRGDGGWTERCEGMVNSGEYRNLDSCFLENNKNIEDSVKEVSNIIEEHNKEMKNLREGITTSRFLGEDIVNDEEFLKRLTSESYRNELNQNLENFEIDVNGNIVEAQEIIQGINSETTYVSQARDLQLNARLLNSDDPVIRSVAESEIKSYLTDIHLNTKKSEVETNLKNNLSEALKGLDVSVHTRGESIIDVYGGGKTAGKLVDIPSGVPAQTLVYGGEEYIVQLEDTGRGRYRVLEVYHTSGNKIEEGEIKSEIQERFMFEFRDRNYYENECPNCELRYYESGQYAGLPAIVPFPAPSGLGDGWYAAMKSNLPIGGSLKAYDDSGRVSSFYLCNVGSNGREEFFLGVGDDDCVGLNPSTNQPYNQFPGLSENEASQLASRAVEAIAEASRRHESGLREISLFGRTISVGEPSVGIPEIQCQDFMSARDCNLMFNICDPFVCPSSRCDLGGKYPVSDVVQSGIAGSLALCAPNFPEVKIPICVSGVYAASQGYANILEDYQSCLEHSLETGQQIGICDQLHSIYMCDFVWRQGLPLANAVIPSVLGEILGQKPTRGGGEYLNARQAWQNAADSAEFFIQEYAVNSADAFQARSIEGVGTEICRNWVSIAGPDGGSLLDSLTSPRVPPQFHGRFDEMEFSTATVPPTSQYKVFFNIYAGEDIPAYYQVYLRSTGGAFFQDTSSRRIVASGFVPVGETANCGDNPNQPCTFTAPSGFNEMCIVVNNQEECGFGRVSTDFAVNYLNDEYIADQVSNTDINSESECVSGTPNLRSFLNPSLQSGAENFIDPGLQNRGIIRICSTDDPGSSTDSRAGTENARWVRVGHCGNSQIGCWLDTESSRDIIRHTGIEDQVVGDVIEDYLEILRNETDSLSASEFRELAREINQRERQNENPLERIEIINKNIERVFLSYEKGFLILSRGNAYKDLVKGVLQSLREQQIEEGEDDEEDVLDFRDNFSGPASRNELQNIERDYPIFEFRDRRITGENIYYTFIENGWYWSMEGDLPEEGGEWFNVGIFESDFENTDRSLPNFSEESFYQEIDINFETIDSDATFVATMPDGTPLPSENMNLENKYWTSLLLEVGYLEGLELLIYRAWLNEENYIFLDSELSTEKVTLKKIGEKGQNFIPVEFTVLGDGFSLGSLINIGETNLYFRFSSQEGWQWSPDRNNWMRTDTIEVNSGKFEGREPTDINSELIQNLENIDDFLEGAAIIFSLDTEKGFPRGNFISREDNNISGGPILPEPNQVESRMNDPDLFDNLGTYEGLIREVSQEYGIEENLIKAIIIQESYADPGAVESAGGSYGLMQVTKVATTDVKARYDNSSLIILSVNINDFERDILKPRKNIYVGTIYFDMLQEYYLGRGNSFEDSKKISLAAYNWGRGNIQNACELEEWKRCENIPSSVLQYVSNIVAYEEELN